MPNFPPLTTAGGLFVLVRDGQASSRADLARITGLAPSTVALRVKALMDAGYIRETGEGESRGGRRPRNISIADEEMVVAGVDLGARHATFVLCDYAGEVLSGHQIGIDIARGPEPVLRDVVAEVHQLCTGLENRRLTGIGIALPGPVSMPEGRIVSPARMPGWNGVDVAALLTKIAGVPARAENDANAVAWGEQVADGRQRRNVIAVKAGSSIGVGIIADGVLHRGARGFAGDVSHTPVAGAPPTICSCGRLGCLDAVAGGQSIIQALAAAGVEVHDMETLSQLAADAHPLAVRLLREAGMRTGAVLATVVGFFNPERLLLAGALASFDAFVASVRSTVYDMCLPLSTSDLEIVEAAAGIEAGARGAAALMIDDLLNPEVIDEVLS